MKVKLILLAVITLITSGSFAQPKSGTYSQENDLPAFFNKPAKVHDMSAFATIDLLYARLAHAQAVVNWYKKEYEKNNPKDNFDICQNIQDIQNQRAFYYANKDVVTAYNKVSSTKFDLEGRISELNKQIIEMRKLLGNDTCADIAKKMGI